MRNLVAIVLGHFGRRVSTRRDCGIIIIIIIIIIISSLIMIQWLKKKNPLSLSQVEELRRVKFPPWRNNKPDVSSVSPSSSDRMLRQFLWKLTFHSFPFRCRENLTRQRHLKILTEAVKIFILALDFAMEKNTCLGKTWITYCSVLCTTGF